MAAALINTVQLILRVLTQHFYLFFLILCSVAETEMCCWSAHIVLHEGDDTDTAVQTLQFDFVIMLNYNK